MGKESAEYEIRKEGLKDKAKITRVETKKAAEIFGEKTKSPEQSLIVIHANVNGWEGRIGTIPKPSAKYVSPKSKMARFIQKYHKPPQTDMSVEVRTNAAGYWALVL
jgi:hypothetical protein